MDLRRHITAGRLSELVGQTDGARDRQGDPHAGLAAGRRGRAAARSSPTTRQYLQAYADGVNAYIDAAGRPSKMALEYAVLGQQVPDYRVEPWTPVDSLAWLKAMAWDLRGNYDDELARARLVGRRHRRPADRPSSTRPTPYDRNQPILSDAGLAARRARSARPGAPAAPRHGRPGDARAPADAARVYADACRSALRRRPGAARARRRHRLQLVGRLRRRDRRTGKPLLANDPHLGASIPGIWYQIGLHCRTVSAGLPVRRLRLHLRRPARRRHRPQPARSPGASPTSARTSPTSTSSRSPATPTCATASYVPLTTRQETIKVAGGERRARSRPQRPCTARSSPTSSTDVAERRRRARRSTGAPDRGRLRRVARRGPALTPGHDRRRDLRARHGARTSTAVPRGGAQDSRSRRRTSSTPTSTGHIGYQAPGPDPDPARPRRPEPPPGYWPAPGLGLAGTTGRATCPFDAAAVRVRPAGGLHRRGQPGGDAPSTDAVPHHRVGLRLPQPADPRPARRRTPKVTPGADVRRSRCDTRNGVRRRRWSRSCCRIDRSTTSPRRPRTCCATGTSPSRRTVRPAAAAAYYNAVWSNLLDLTFDDELPGDIQADGGGRWMQAVRAAAARTRTTRGGTTSGRRA